MDAAADSNSRAVIRDGFAAAAEFRAALTPSVLLALLDDAERIDWMERFCFKAVDLDDEEWALVWCDPDGNEHNVDGAPLRECIDRARSTPGGET
jgi:hypothetical protein